MVDRAIAFLESPEAVETRMGGRALLALTLLKNGAPASHPKVVSAAKEVVEAANSLQHTHHDIYTLGLCITFLVTLEPSATGTYSPAVEKLLAHLHARQQSHGAWGYPASPTGDTSMVQYAILGIWEATQVGYRYPLESVEALAVWLARVQDPSGAFPYQGKPSQNFIPLKQEGIRYSLLPAGMGATYICADLLGFSEVAKPRPKDVPNALKEVQSPAERSARSDLNPRVLRDVMARGDPLLARPDMQAAGASLNYFLYSLERYWSFREQYSGTRVEEPAWYNDGVRVLKATQAPNGKWEDKQCGPVPDTCFGVLFLIRSSRKSIERAKGFGAGTLVGGRDLRRLARESGEGPAKQGSKAMLAPVEKLLSGTDEMAYEEADAAMEALADLPLEETRSLVSKHAQQMRQLAGGPSPEARAVAIRALAKTRNLDHVPLLISALDDPDLRVVKEANDGLRRMSGRLAGGALPDPFTNVERQDLIKQWKTWFLAIRPGAQFEN